MKMATKRALHRTSSVNKVEEMAREEKKARVWMPDKPIHRHTDSLFSTSSGFTNYRGLLNLALILLVLSNTRLFLENLIKYGILINPFVYMEWFIDEPYNWPNVLLTLSVSVFPCISFGIECALAKDWISDKTGFFLHTINNTVLLVYPAVIIYIKHPNPVFSAFTLGIVTIVFLKMISYGHVNYWCRLHLRNGGNRLSRRRKTVSATNDTHSDSEKTIEEKNLGSVIVYPKNLTLSDLCYFLCAPTLCYELNFPRSARIRKRFLAKRMLEMLFLTSLMLGLVQQWIVPTVNNSLKPLSEMDFFRVMERLLKLAVPNHFIWLIFFYCMFHSMLNVSAELLRFGDREFYKDWWNAENVSEFWQNWNIPVHRWALRHVYKPLLRRGTSKMVASLAVFVLSAFFHEYLVSIPLRMFKVWAFMGMVMQMPLAYISSMFFRGKWGNIIVWFSLILGQPIAIFAYVHDYYIMTVTGGARATA
ncbi:hypothetical protein C0Q70_18889 [Pomacea canaliculata]|uniref:O-acyltransferase n=1 Tax=Pomacea canaliculata TaxID=400727 RepID=A0A2T7NHV6_POMCA|nr:diacylglycerol O-acyltransferase 1-like isoform X3 [Pomacea canaliculata]PVD20728.1 hypothetical protein C0Q70_18889 [Pomacea canaliculata]